MAPHFPEAWGCSADPTQQLGTIRCLSTLKRESSSAGTPGDPPTRATRASWPRGLLPVWGRDDRKEAPDDLRHLRTKIHYARRRCPRSEKHHEAGRARAAVREASRLD